MSEKWALAGNPNCGKTTLFNALTGSNQYVGNWPGVTVEKKEGKINHDTTDATIVDLPGIYSLSPYSMEEIVTRNFLIDEKPDIIIDIVDATNLERNLYLSLQLAELGKPMVIALNMMDILEKDGSKINYELLSRYLKLPVVPISAGKNTGIHKLIHTADHIHEHIGDTRHIDIHTNKDDPPDIYTGELKSAIEAIEKIIKNRCKEKDIPLRWSAVKLIEGDEPTINSLELEKSELEAINNIAKKLEHDGMDREMIVADQKYKFICSVREKILKRGRNAGKKSVSERIDSVVTNRFLAIPVFALIMGLVFYLTFGALGANLSAVVDKLINVKFAEIVRNALMSAGVADWLQGLVCDGAIAGLGAVLSFFPQIFLLFFFLSILEDSGYMSRAAFIMDKALHIIGLSGKSFVPMLMGFGCSVPAIMATRTLENEKDRRITMMMVPFMSCSAKMPVYSLFIAAFFSAVSAPVIVGIYLIGVIVAVAVAFLAQKTFLKGGHAPFVMELPAYRLPTAKTLGLHLWEKIKDFFSKAATVLLGASIIIWFLQYFSFSFHHVTDSSQSMLAVIGQVIAPIFKPLGFGDWKSSVSILSGLIARESIVSTLGILNGTGGEATTALTAILQKIYTPAAAFSFMTFSLLFIPCVASVATMRKELGSKKKTFVTLSIQAVTAYIVTLFVYNVVLLLSGNGENLLKFFIEFIIIILAVFFVFLAVKTTVKNHKNGTCGCNCSDCNKNCKH